MNYQVKLTDKSIIIKAESVDEAIVAAHRIADRYDYDDSDLRIKTVNVSEAELEETMMPYFASTGRQLA